MGQSADNLHPLYGGCFVVLGLAHVNLEIARIGLQVG